jgi:hypothetical protein
MKSLSRKAFGQYINFLSFSHCLKSATNSVMERSRQVKAVNGRGQQVKESCSLLSLSRRSGFGSLIRRFRFAVRVGRVSGLRQTVSMSYVYYSYVTKLNYEYE